MSAQGIGGPTQEVSYLPNPKPSIKRDFHAYPSLVGAGIGWTFDFYPERSHKWIGATARFEPNAFSRGRLKSLYGFL